MSLFSRHVGRHWNTFYKVYKIRNAGNRLCPTTNSVGTKEAIMSTLGLLF